MLYKYCWIKQWMNEYPSWRNWNEYLIGFPSKTYNWSFPRMLMTLQGTESFPGFYALLVGQFWSLLDPKIQLSSPLTLRWSDWVHIRQSSDENILVRTPVIGLSSWFSGFPMFFFFFFFITHLTECPLSFSSHPFWFAPPKYHSWTVIKKVSKSLFICHL